ncbi:META domain-containing protein [Bizionia sp. KMM 8389]
MKYISLLVTCIFILSCGNAKEATAMNEPTPLVGTYQLKTIGLNTPINTPLQITFNIEKKMVSGNSGCNQFSGSYLSEGSALEFGPLASTRKMCPPAINTLEQQILKALKETKQYSQTDTVISLLDNSGAVVLTIAKEIPVEKVAKKSTITDYKTEYTAISRGSYMVITYQNKSLAYQKSKDSNPVIKLLSDEEIARLDSKINALNLQELKVLEAPSKAFQHDGAPIASLSVVHNGSTYLTPSFDHGNPPESIVGIINELIALTEK